MKFSNIPFFGKRSTVADEDLLTRSSIMEPSVVNEEDRTISAILATEQPVAMFDYRSGKTVDEVLVAVGGRMPSKMPLLDSHSRFSSSSVLGSVREIRMDGDKWRGTVHFARNAGERADQIWELVRQEHLEDGSIGYRFDDDSFVDIPPGETREVLGKSYTAGKRTLRIVTAWQGREYSTTPIGADDQAKLGRQLKPETASGVQKDSGSKDQTRSQEQTVSDGTTAMNEALRKFLLFLGLRSDATDEKAQQFLDLLPDDKRSQAGRIESGKEQFEEPKQRSEPATIVPPDAPPTNVVEQMRAENARVDYIRGFVDQVPNETIQQAIREGWDEARSSQEFLTHFRNRGEAASSYIGIHDATASKAVTKQAMQAAVLMRSGFNIDSELFDAREVTHALRGSDTNASWLVNAREANKRGGKLSDESSRALEVAHRYRSVPALEICREALALEGARFDRHDNREVWQRSLSSAAVSEIFTTNFAVQLLSGFVGRRDTTVGWCRESDVANFQTVERKQMGKGSKLTRRERGQEAKHGQIDAIGESFRIYEYTSQFFIDFQDMVDDRLGALDVMPQEMGEAAGEVRPDLVYYILMSNPNMGRDGVAIFAAAHNNLSTSTALSADGLDAMKVKMRTATNNGRLIDIQPGGIIVPEIKESLALEILGSREKRDTTASTKYVTNNWAFGRFNPIAEPRLDVGVTDPITGTQQAAKPGSFYMVAENGRYGMEVGYLAGTGRRPTMRKFVATEGRFGMGYDIQHFVGAKAIGYEGLQEARA